MALEDFFTLKEMKDGLSSIARVEELVSVIQNAKECPTNNKSDITRQWTTVARTLAATKHKECLDHFLLLNGLSFLSKWLQEATDPSTDTSSTNTEEIVIALLASLEKLPVDKETVIAFGIEVIIKQHLDHKSHQIKEKAIMLHDKWKFGVDNVSDCVDLKEEETFQGDLPEPCEQSKISENDISSVNSVARINSCNPENSGGSQVRESTSLEAGSPPVSSPILDSSICAANQVGSQEDPFLQSANSENCYNHSKVMSFKDDADIVEISDGREANGSQRDTSSNPSTSIPVSETPYVSNDEPAIFDDLASKDMCSSLSKSVNSDCKTQVVDGCLFKSEMNEVPKLVASVGKGFEECHAPMSNISSETPYQKSKFVRVDGQSRGLNSLVDIKNSKGNAITCTASLSKAENVVIDLGQNSDLEIVYVDDALEVARQVAIQVEREVVDYREPFCSSPDYNSGEIAGASRSEGKDEQPAVQELSGASSCEKEQHDGSSSSKESSEITETLCSDPKKYEHVESQMLNNLVQEPTAKPDNDKCVFDLNADICSEETECRKSTTNEQVNLSAPTAIDASAKGMPLLPVAPSHFEEGLGWIASAASSPFLPVTSQRTLDSEREVSITKQKTNFIDIDLNIAEGCDEVIEPIFAKQFPASSSLPSENSSVDVSSKKPERLHLDLNRTGDEDASMYPSGHLWLKPNGENSLSSASSSSRRHSLIDFDLNDNPTLMDIDSSQNFSKSSSKITDRLVVSKLNDPVAMVMEPKMAVERKDYHMQLLPPNGLSMEHTPFPRLSMPFAHMGRAIYDYNRMPARPTMPAPQAFYSPSSIPYMADARTQPVIPHVSGAGGFNAAASARPPFLMSAPMGPSHTNLYSSFHPGFDSNSGVTLLDVGTKEGGNSKQLFLHGQVGVVQEQIKATHQPSSSGSTVKRKEPESGWEPYPYGYNQVAQWQ